MLALGAEVRAPPSHNDPRNRRLAPPAGFTGPLVDAMLELEEAFHSFGIHVIGDRGASHLDGLLQHGLQRLAQTLQLRTGKPSGSASWPETGVEQAFVGVDVAHAREQRLVEQGGLDSQLAPAEQRAEGGGFNGQRFQAGCLKSWAGAQIAPLQPAKTTRIHKTEFLSAG